MRHRLKCALDPIESDCRNSLESILLSHYLIEFIKKVDFIFPFYEMDFIARKMAEIFGFSILLSDEKLREIFNEHFQFDEKRSKLAKVEINRIKLEKLKRIKESEEPENIRKRLHLALFDFRQYNW